MKMMTLNTHSWLEESPEEKMRQIVDKICQADYDVIALQEVNQLITSESIVNEELNKFCPVIEQSPVHVDNFAYCLVRYLAKQGKDYYWSWEMSHVGYGIYEEGNARLSKTPLTSEAIYVSETKQKEDYHTRKILICQTMIDDQTITLASCHFSWWIDETKGFAFEWHCLMEHLANLSNPLFLMGDFNNPAGEAGYRLVEKSPLAIVDSYTVAQEVHGQATIEQKIDGWETNTEQLRIDYIYVPQEFSVPFYRSIFDGKQEIIVSDHYGVEITVSPIQ